MLQSTLSNIFVKCSISLVCDIELLSFKLKIEVSVEEGWKLEKVFSLLPILGVDN